jgi:hypothetical protein
LADGQSVILDGWGRPIIIQVHNSYGARLVSAGPGQGLGLRDEHQNLQAQLETKIGDAVPQGDDRILNLQGSTPANTSCDSS